MGGHVLRQVSLIFFACLVTSACAGLERHPARPISKIEARSLPPDIVTRRTLDQLADVLVLPQYTSQAARPRRALDSLWFSTRPRATEIHGLCQSDTAIISFLPEGSDTPNADTPTRATGIRSWSRFRFLAPPVESMTTMTTVETERAQRACSGLNPDDVNFFHAPDAQDAHYGMLELIALLDWIKSGVRPFQVSCPYHNGDCTPLFAGLGIDSIQGIQRCTRPDEALCWLFDTGDLKIAAIHDGKQPGESALTRVIIAEYVIIADQLID